MEIYISDQLRTFLLAVFLGFALASLYDLAGAVRARYGRLTWVLDGAYCLCALASLFFFTLRQSGGQLRLFVVLGAVGGGVLFFTGFSPWLRPVWVFWLDVLALFWSILMIPLQLSKKIGKEIVNFTKKVFYFFLKWYTIKYHYQFGYHKGGMGNGAWRKKREKTP